MDENVKKGWKQIEYKGYKYFKDNPSLTIWESINGILKDSGLSK